MRAKTRELFALLESHGAVAADPDALGGHARCPIPNSRVVIPVYNEEQVLPTLFARLYPALDALGISYECVFVNDGSQDRSVALLRMQFQRRPRETRVVLFHANFGQHSAVMAGLSYARGDYVVTLDADLQNPPEEIGKLVDKLDEGYDYVGTIRQQRQDIFWRRVLSKAINKHARADHAGADHRSGLHDARLRALRGDRAQSRRARSTPSSRRWRRCTR